MPGLRLVRTVDLTAAERSEVRGLLVHAFAGDFSEHDWEHALGGTHALLRSEGRLVGHAALVPRRLFHLGRALWTGYVEALAVDPDARRRGHGTELMRALARSMRTGGFELGALAATDAGAALYAPLGWLRWEGPTLVLSPEGWVRTPEDDGSVHVLPLSAGVDVREALGCDWRSGDPW